MFSKSTASSDVPEVGEGLIRRCIRRCSKHLCRAPKQATSFRWREGFMLHDRLLRPAQVGVSSMPAMLDRIRHLSKSRIRFGRLLVCRSSLSLARGQLVGWMSSSISLDGDGLWRRRRGGKQRQIVDEGFLTHRLRARLFPRVPEQRGARRHDGGSPPVGRLGRRRIGRRPLCGLRAGKMTSPSHSLTARWRFPHRPAWQKGCHSW